MDQLVELLHMHDPERAERVRARLAGPEPDGVLVLGPDVASVGRLAMVVAARVPGRVVCSPVEAPPSESLLAHTRAVVWVFHSGAATPRWGWARLAELAGEVDEVHVVLAGPHQRWRDRERLARQVPRLGDHPVHLLTDNPHELVTALLATTPAARERNALRVLRTGLDQQLARGERRDEHAAQRELATDRALRTHRAELSAARGEAASALPKRVRDDLIAARSAVSVSASEAFRALRDDAGDQLDQLDRAGRLAFPDRFASAGVRLTEQLVTGLDRSLDRIEYGFGSSVAEDRGVAAVPRLVAPGLRTGLLEGRLMLLLGASAGLGLGRAAMVSEAALPVALGSATLPLAVGVGFGLAWLLVAGKRAMNDRARLRCWVAESVGDLRGTLEATVAERVRFCERRLLPLVEERVAQRAAALDVEQRRHEVLAHRVAARRTAAEPDVAAELRRAGAELDRLLAGVSTRAVA